MTPATMLRSAAVAAAGVCILAIATPAIAQTTAGIDCSSQSNLCSASVTVDPSDAQPLRYLWGFVPQPGVAPVFKKDCTNKTFCAFYCPQHGGILTATFTVKDANGAVLATDSQPASCTAQAEPGMGALTLQ